MPCHDHKNGGVLSVVFSADSRFLISSGWDGGIMCWDVSSLAPPDDLSKDMPMTQGRDMKHPALHNVPIRENAKTMVIISEQAATRLTLALAAPNTLSPILD